MDIDVVSDAVAETLEALCFMEAELVNDGAADIGEERMCWSQLDLRAPVNGEMTVVMPVKLLDDIITVVYGDAETPQDEVAEVPQEEDSETEEVEKEVDSRVLDTLGELANTLAGNVLKRVVPPDQAFTISLPEVGEGFGDVSGMDPYLFRASGYTFGLYLKTGTIDGR